MAEQVLRSERGYVVQSQGTFEFPKKFSASVIYRFLSGKPYNRQLSVGQRHRELVNEGLYSKELWT